MIDVLPFWNTRVDMTGILSLWNTHAKIVKKDTNFICWSMSRIISYIEIPILIFFDFKILLTSKQLAQFMLCCLEVTQKFFFNDLLPKSCQLFPSYTITTINQFNVFYISLTVYTSNLFCFFKENRFCLAVFYNFEWFQIEEGRPEKAETFWICLFTIVFTFISGYYCSICLFLLIYQYYHNFHLLNDNSSIFNGLFA